MRLDELEDRKTEIEKEMAEELTKPKRGRH